MWNSSTKETKRDGRIKKEKEKKELDEVKQPLSLGLFLFPFFCAFTGQANACVCVSVCVSMCVSVFLHFCNHICCQQYNVGRKFLFQTVC